MRRDVLFSLFVAILLGWTMRAAFGAEMTLESFVAGGHISAPFGVVRPGLGEHRGVDVAAPLGTPILAPRDAVVLEASDLFRDQPRYGKAVVLKFGDDVTAWFTHLDSYSVKAGDAVSRGTAFATIGRATGAKAPHIHIETFIALAGFEIRVDPASRLPFLGNGGQAVKTEEETFYRKGKLVRYPGYGTDTIAEIYEGRWRHDEVQLAGLLFLPEGAGPFPVVVLQHGSGTPNGLDGWWRHLIPELQKAGIGAFIANSYIGRGIGETTGDQTQLSRAARLVDALMALDAISRLPQVDASRIGISGYSFGGAVSIDTADERIARAVLRPGLRFAAHLPLYPNCVLREDIQMTGAPIRFLLGEKDDYTPISTCLALIEELKKAGVPAAASIYNGAGHGFVKARGLFLPRAVTFSECPPVRLTTDGYLQGDGFSDRRGGWAEYVSAGLRVCGKRGAHVLGTAESRRRAEVETVEFFRTVFKIK